MQQTVASTNKTTQAEPIIKVQHLSKHYQKVSALNDFNLEIPRGSIYGLIGPNGAGKTTLLRILAALLTPTSGQVWFENQEVTRYPTVIQRKVGYMPDFFGVYPDLTTEEYLEFYAGIHGIPKKQRPAIITDLLELVDLSDKRQALVEMLSRGMKQRLCLARALVHDPEILLLDEPASGLDPRARIELRELVRSLQEMGKTIIISSHILPELSEMCTDIAIIVGGNLVIAGDVDKIVDQAGGGQQLEIHLLRTEEMSEALAVLTQMDDLQHVTQSDATVILANFRGERQRLATILTDLIDHDLSIVSFAPRPGNNRLEEIFMQLTEDTEGKSQK